MARTIWTTDWCSRRWAMTRMSVPCRRDLACYRNDGHPGDHLYPTSESVPVLSAEEEPRGWTVWDLDTGNACGWYATETEARVRRDAFAAANPDSDDDFIVFHDPMTSESVPS